MLLLRTNTQKTKAISPRRVLPKHLARCRKMTRLCVRIVPSISRYGKEPLGVSGNRRKTYSNHTNSYQALIIYYACKTNKLTIFDLGPIRLWYPIILKGHPRYSEEHPPGLPSAPDVKVMEHVFRHADWLGRSVESPESRLSLGF